MSAILAKRFWIILTTRLGLQLSAKWIGIIKDVCVYISRHGDITDINLDYVSLWLGDIFSQWGSFIFIADIRQM